MAETLAVPASVLQNTLKRGSSVSVFRRGKQACVYAPLIADYTLQSEICGVDDISYIYKAKHIPSNASVSLVLTDLKLSGDLRFVGEILKGVRNTGWCRHANVLGYYVTFIENDRVWYVSIANLLCFFYFNLQILTLGLSLAQYFILSSHFSLSIIQLGFPNKLLRHY